MSALSQKARSIRPVMNVTPLVDVVLVLLIIFMVVLPMMENEVQITLPSLFNIDEVSRGRADPFTLSVDRQGRLYLEQRRLGPEDLREHLTAANRREPHRRLLLRADRDARYGDVRSLFHICQQIGFPGVSLVVSERGERS